MFSLKSSLILLLAAIAAYLFLFPPTPKTSPSFDTSSLDNQTENIIFSESQSNPFFEKSCYLTSFDSQKSSLLKSLESASTTAELQKAIADFNHSRLNHSNYEEEKINFDLFKNASFEVQKQLLKACILQSNAYWKYSSTKGHQSIFCGIPSYYLLETTQRDSLNYQLIEEVEQPTFSANINGKWHPLLKSISPDHTCKAVAFNSDTFTFNP